MTCERDRFSDPRIQAAIQELQELILAHYPTTTFTVYEGEDPEGIYVRAVVDVDDTGEVTALFIDRMVDMQIDEELSIYVIPVRTPERQAADEQWRQAGRHLTAYSIADIYAEARPQRRAKPA